MPFGVGLRRGFFFFLFLYLSSLVCGFDPPPKNHSIPPLALKMLEERDKENNQAKKEQKFIFIRKGEWVPMFHHFTSLLLSACTFLFLLPLDGRRSRNEKTRLLRRFNARRDRGCAQTHSLQRVRIGKKMYNPTEDIIFFAACVVSFFQERTFPLVSLSARSLSMTLSK